MVLGQGRTVNETRKVRSKDLAEYINNRDLIRELVENVMSRERLNWRD